MGSRLSRQSGESRSIAISGKRERVHLLVRQNLAVNLLRTLNGIINTINLSENSLKLDAEPVVDTTNTIINSLPPDIANYISVSSCS